MMQDRLSDFVSFSGRLEGAGHTADVTFRARVRQSGEVEFDFIWIQLTDRLQFYFQSYNKLLDLVPFSLIGKAEDGTELETSHLHFSSMDEKPIGSSLHTTFRWKLEEPIARPILCMHLKGFKHFAIKPVTCPLGEIEITGATSLPDPDILTGMIRLQPEEAPSDLDDWRLKADKLMDHVRRIMSFGAGTMLRAPIVEFCTGGDIEVTALSQTRQSISPIPTFHYMRQHPAFETAVHCFFNPPIEINDLFYALEWFVWKLLITRSV